ncbi:DUF2812 domain-containing protein [Planococcus sp. MERTA32b]|nr:DUF2812 domain-containing protein [Planococcus sp. MER TA 32b]
MKTFKKFKISLANDMDKEEQWLTEMSAKGYHCYKYRPFTYYFEEDPTRSYVYQVDFQSSNDEYFELYKQAGWEHVHTAMESFHYFRAPKDVIGDKRIYSDPTSIKNMYQRMLMFYSIIFICMLVAQAGLLLNWDATFFSILSLTIVSAVIILYIYLFIRLLQKMKKYDKQSHIN